MTEKTNIVAYWGARKEDVQQCSKRLAQMLSEFSTEDDLFTRWRLKGRSKREAEGNVISGSFDSIMRTLVGSRSRRDDDATVMDELGFKAALWTEDSRASASLSLRCGLFDTTPGLCNSIVLKLTGVGAWGSSDGADRLLRSMVRAWDPDWAAVAAETAMVSETYSLERPLADSILYLRESMDADIERLRPKTLRVAGGEGGVFLFLRPR